MWNIHRMENYLAIKRSKRLTLAIQWMNVGNIVVSEINQMQRVTYCLSHLYKILRKAKSTETGIRIMVAQS